MSNRQVSRKLFVSIKTVNSTFAHIYSRIRHQQSRQTRPLSADPDADDGLPFTFELLRRESRSPGPPARSYPEQRQQANQGSQPQLTPDGSPQPRPRRLTPESAVAAWSPRAWATGKGAGELFVSIEPCNSTSPHLYGKFGIDNRAELAAHFDTSRPFPIRRLLITTIGAVWSAKDAAQQTKMRRAAGKAHHHRPNPSRCPRSHRQSPPVAVWRDPTT